MRFRPHVWQRHQRLYSPLQIKCRRKAWESWEAKTAKPIWLIGMQWKTTCMWFVLFVLELIRSEEVKGNFVMIYTVTQSHSWKSSQNAVRLISKLSWLYLMCTEGMFGEILKCCVKLSERFPGHSFRNIRDAFRSNMDWIESTLSWITTLLFLVELDWTCFITD